MAIKNYKMIICDIIEENRPNIEEKFNGNRNTKEVRGMHEAHSDCR